jgi:hypothetical protein
MSITLAENVSGLFITSMGFTMAACASVKLLRPKSCQVLFQYPDDLFFGVSAALHRPSPSRNGLYLKIEGTFGGKVMVVNSDYDDLFWARRISDQFNARRSTINQRSFAPDFDRFPMS